jgi:hypothetical protein
MLKFQRPDSEMTLREGLREYYGSQDGLVTGRGPSSSAQEFFRCHDAAHVVFGCSTRLVDEAMVKLWSFLGTTAGFSLLRDYRSPESKEIYQTIEWRDIGPTILASIVNVPRVIAGCLRMNERWPWSDFDQWLDVPLSQIRQRYQIRIVSRS